MAVSMSWVELAKGAYNVHAGTKAKPFENLPRQEQDAWQNAVKYVVRTMSIPEPTNEASTRRVDEVAPISEETHPKPENEVHNV